LRTLAASLFLDFHWILESDRSGRRLMLVRLAHRSNSSVGRTRETVESVVLGVSRTIAPFIATQRAGVENTSFLSAPNAADVEFDGQVDPMSCV